jgi:hypothetical protein
MTARRFRSYQQPGGYRHIRFPLRGPRPAGGLVAPVTGPFGLTRARKPRDQGPLAAAARNPGRREPGLRATSLPNSQDRAASDVIPWTTRFPARPKSPFPPGRCCSVSAQAPEPNRRGGRSPFSANDTSLDPFLPKKGVPHLSGVPDRRQTTPKSCKAARSSGDHSRVATVIPALATPRFVRRRRAVPPKPPSDPTPGLSGDSPPCRSSLGCHPRTAILLRKCRSRRSCPPLRSDPCVPSSHRPFGLCNFAPRLPSG